MEGVEKEIEKTERKRTAFLEKAMKLLMGEAETKDFDSLVDVEKGKLIQKQRKLEKERDKLKEKVSIFAKQKEEFKSLYQEAERRTKELSEKQPVEKKTVRISKVLED